MYAEYCNNEFLALENSTFLALQAEEEGLFYEMFKGRRICQHKKSYTTLVKEKYFIKNLDGWKRKLNKSSFRSWPNANRVRTLAQYVDLTTVRLEYLGKWQFRKTLFAHIYGTLKLPGMATASTFRPVYVYRSIGRLLEFVKGGSKV